MNREEYEYQQKVAKIFYELQPVFNEIYGRIEEAVVDIVIHVAKKYFETFKDEEPTLGKIVITVLAAINMVSEELKSERSISEIIDKVYDKRYVWEEEK